MPRYMDTISVELTDEEATAIHDALGRIAGGAKPESVAHVLRVALWNAVEQEGQKTLTISLAVVHGA